MAKTISIELSTKDIKRAQEEIRAYQIALNRKVETFIDKLAKVGLSVAQAVLSGVQDEDLKEWDISLTSNKEGEISKAEIMLKGGDVLFIEFGTGIRYAQPQNPLAGKMGYGSGTYPGQTHVPNPGYWYYKDGNQEKHKSYGNRAYMPMYHASEALALELSRIAKEVFE